MKHLLKITILIFILFFSSHGWCSDGYIRNNSGNLEYTTNSLGCSYAGSWGDVSDDFGANDLEEFCKDSVGEDICYVCGSEYDNSTGSFTDTTIDSDDNSFHFQSNSQRLQAVGTVTLTTTSGTRVINGNSKTGVTVDGFYKIKAPDDADSRYGVYFNGANSTITNCVIEGPGSGASYIGHVGIYNLAANPTITNNRVHGFNLSIRVREDSGGNGYGGLVQNNFMYDQIVGNIGNADCINVNGTAVRDFDGLEIIGNTCIGFGDDGIDLYYGSNVLVEENLILTPIPNFVGNGIKGGSSGSTGNKIKRNKIILMTPTTQGANSQAGINTNSATNGEMSFNLVLGLNGTSGYGSIIDANNWKVINNIFQAEDRAISCGNGLTGLTVQDDIFDGQDGIDFRTGTAVIAGGYNILVNDSDVSDDGSNYTNTNNSDQYATDPLFVNPGTDSTGATEIYGSFADGQAWLEDDAGILTSYANSGYMVIVTDGTYYGIGYIGEVGSGLTLGSELVVNGTFDTDTVWSKSGGWSISGGVAAHPAGSSGNLMQEGIIIQSIGTLFNIEVETVSSSGGNCYLTYGAFTGNPLGYTVYNNVGVHSNYVNKNADSGWLYIYANSSAERSLDNISVKEVTEPASSAVHIYKESTLQNEGWLYYPDGLDFNNLISFTIIGNYSLKEDSPAIDNGTPISGIHDSAWQDYAGSQFDAYQCFGEGIDIGAYEMIQNQMLPFFDSPALKFGQPKYGTLSISSLLWNDGNYILWNNGGYIKMNKIN